MKSNYIILTCCILLSGCSFMSLERQRLTTPKQKIIRVWKGGNNDPARKFCGLPVDRTVSYLNSGWKIVSNQPFQYEKVTQTFGTTYTWLCLGTEIVLESKY